MDHLSIIPVELYRILADFLTVHDIVNWSRLSKHFEFEIGVPLVEYIYDIASKNEMNTRLKIEIVNNNIPTMFISYTRGKSYVKRRGEDLKVDIPFKLLNDEMIIYFSNIELYNNGPGLIIITITRNLMYNIYEFSQEVNHNTDFSSDYWSCDNDDFTVGGDIYILEASSSYTNMNEFIIYITFNKFLNSTLDNKSKLINIHNSIKQLQITFDT